MKPPEERKVMLEHIRRHRVAKIVGDKRAQELLNLMENRRMIALFNNHQPQASPLGNRETGQKNEHHPTKKPVPQETHKHKAMVKVKA